MRLDPQQLAEAQQQAVTWLHQHQQQLLREALTTGSTLVTVVTGLILTLFALIFFLHDGASLWRATCRIVPRAQRARVTEAGHRAFSTLSAFMRATCVVTAVNALGIGIALAATGVPLAGSLTALVFLAGFVPVLGALAAGAIAVLMTLVTQGFVAALIVLAVVVVVHELEGNVLQPWLLGGAVRLHPLAIVFGVTGGAAVAGVAGARWPASRT